MEVSPLTDQEFASFQQLLNQIAGIHLSSAKKPLVSSRLGKRLQQRQCNSFGEYYQQLRGHDGRDELQIAVDLLTTNETYFFREPKHFDFLKQHILRRTGEARRSGCGAPPVPAGRNRTASP